MTLRGRLLIGLGIVGLGALLISGVGIYLEAHLRLGAQFDAELVSRIKRAVPVGSRVGVLPLGLCAAARQLQLLSAEGEVIATCPATALSRPKASVIRDAIVYGHALNTTRIGDRSLRVAVVSLKQGKGHRPQLLHAAEPLDRLISARSSLLRSSLLIGSFAILFLLIAGYVAISRAIRQVNEITNRARALVRGDEAGRIDQPESPDLESLVFAFNGLLDRLERRAREDRTAARKKQNEQGGGGAAHPS